MRRKRVLGKQRWEFIIIILAQKTRDVYYNVFLRRAKVYWGYMAVVNMAVFPTILGLEEPAIALAQQLNLPFTLSLQARYDYLLVMTPDYIGLQKTKGSQLPLYVDFLSGKKSYRSQHTSLKNETLARAMGLKGKTNPRIIDATGGLAGDAFVLAGLGFAVTLLERSSIIYALVEDGIRRAHKDRRTIATVNRLHLVHTDAISWLQQLKVFERPEIIYLDPMFPERKKSALPRREMLILHDIVGEDSDADVLLKAALTCATKRVVVKRPRLAARLVADPAPSFSLSGSSSRFDVYVTAHTATRATPALNAAKRENCDSPSSENPVA